MYHIIIIVILIWCVQNSNGRPKHIIIIINSSFVTRSKYSQITDILSVYIKTTKHKKERKKLEIIKIKSKTNVSISEYLHNILSW